MCTTEQVRPKYDQRCEPVTKTIQILISVIETEYQRTKTHDMKLSIISQIIQDSKCPTRWQGFKVSCSILNSCQQRIKVFMILTNGRVLHMPAFVLDFKAMDVPLSAVRMLWEDYYAWHYEDLTHTGSSSPSSPSRGRLGFSLPTSAEASRM
jgi:hypothetical protein